MDGRRGHRHAHAEHAYPEGGYGWVVTAAFAVNSVLTRQLANLFGLIFKDVFHDRNILAAEFGTVMNLNVSLNLLLGIFAGFMVRRFGCRRVAAVGAVLVTSGMLLTSFATSFVEFIIGFGIILAAGIGMTAPAFSVAFNSYFQRRRTLAATVAVTLTGIAGILMPQIVSLLLWEYGPHGTCMFVAGLSFHTLAAAALLQPIKQSKLVGRRAPSHTPAGTSAIVTLEEREQDCEKDADSTPLDMVFTFPALPVLDVEADAESMLDGAFSLPALPVLEEETDADLEHYEGLAPPSQRPASTVSSCEQPDVYSSTSCSGQFTAAFAFAPS